jgi:PAS domain-containing protein
MNFRRYIHPDDVGLVFDTYHMVFPPHGHAGGAGLVHRGSRTTAPHCQWRRRVLRMDEIGKRSRALRAWSGASPRGWHTRRLQGERGALQGHTREHTGGVLRGGPGRQLTFLNSSLSRILGYPASELLGASYRKCVDEGISCRIYETFQGVFLTGEPDRGLRLGDQKTRRGRKDHRDNPSS